MKLIENHMVIGPPEPECNSDDFFEIKSHGCEYLEDGKCLFYEDAPECRYLDPCPDGRW